MIKLAVFASGNGSNAERIIQYFKKHSGLQISEIFTNNPHAYVIERAKTFGVECFIFNKEDLYQTNKVYNRLIELDISHIILAGFLWLIPENIIDAFPAKIINIHPALLPKYGGKGMYGMHVHQAVIEHNETESGISIHYVNKHYDEGDIIFQAKCTIEPNETAQSLAAKIHQLEYDNFPVVIEQIINLNGF
ncbi:MAG: phosphoribosylglycinamide formyltransferase [Bacteroidota bacterium]